MTVFETLLGALRRSADPDAWLADAAKVDRDDLAVAALALGLAPLLHRRLESWDRALPDAQAQAKLAFARRAEAARHAQYLSQLGEVLAALDVPVIVLKGAYLADQVYPAPGLRPMNDIDLLFRVSDLPAAGETLSALGYLPKEKSPDLGPGITKHTRTFKRAEPGAATPNPYLSPGASRMIEPHGSLEESWFGLKCDITPGVWERSREIQIAGQPARALSPEDTLLHLCVHLIFHLIMGSPSFVQLADLGVYLERREVDWEGLVRLARESRAAGYGHAALRLAASALAAPVPDGALHALGRAAPWQVRQAGMRLGVRDVVRRTQQPPLRTVPQRLARGVADRAEAARWAHSWREWLRVWWTLADVRRTDTWQMLRRPKPEA